MRSKNNKEKLALIADANSIWTKEYIKNVLLNFGYDIYIISNNNEKFAEFYVENDCKVLLTKNNKNKMYKNSKFASILYTFNTYMCLLKLKPQLIIVEYVHRHIAKLLNYYKFKSKKVLLFIGSDLLRTSEKKLLSIRKTIKKSDEIVLMTTDMQKKFNDVYGKLYNQKINIIDMGDSVFESIDFYLNKSTKNIHLTDYIKIVIGYNASKAQQHEKVIKELNELDEVLKNKIYVFVPMTYPNDDSYINYIKELMSKTKIKFKILTDYLNFEEMAKLCINSDIFINSQKSDALSNTMLEFLYANKIVINGSWLKYSILDNLELEYFSFEKFDELRFILEKIINNNSINIENNHNKIKNHFTWDYCKNQWDRII